MTEASLYLTAGEVAKELRISKATVTRLIQRDELDAVRVGKALRIPRNELASFIVRNSTSKMSAPVISENHEG